MSALKSMTSKFKGKCFECSSPILPSWPILWSKETGAKHKVCPAVGTEILQKALNKPKSQNVTQLGDFTEVYAMFASAAKTNKVPKIKINADGFEFYLYVSGFKSAHPCEINVKSKGWGGEWYGRITEAGAWTHRGEVDERMADALSKLQMDPVVAVAEFGKLCGRCCFCNSGLSDLKSVDVGYGPICAQKWGLPWGSTGPKMIVGHTHTASLEKGPHHAVAMVGNFEQTEAKVTALLAEAKESGIPIWVNKYVPDCTECHDSGFLPPYAAEGDTPCRYCDKYESLQKDEAAVAGAPVG